MITWEEGLFRMLCFAYFGQKSKEPVIKQVLERVFRRVGVSRTHKSSLWLSDYSLEYIRAAGEVLPHWGHYFIEEAFCCDGCSRSETKVYVKAWIEIEERWINVVFTYNSETGQPEKELPLSS